MDMIILVLFTMVLKFVSMPLLKWKTPSKPLLFDRGEGRGCLSKQTGRSYSSDGTHICTVETWDVCIYDGGWGGPKPPRDIVEIPDRAPDKEVTETMPYNMPLIYRLMGDWHQQHIDWSYTEQQVWKDQLLMG